MPFLPHKILFIFKLLKKLLAELVRILFKSYHIKIVSTHFTVFTQNKNTCQTQKDLFLGD